MNLVRLVGNIKRDEQAVELPDGTKILDFAVAVQGQDGRWDVFDCRATNRDGVVDALDGYVQEGEEIAIEGRLEKRTSTDEQRVAGSLVRVKNTQVRVYVTGLLEDYDTEEIDG